MFSSIIRYQNSWQQRLRSVLNFHRTDCTFHPPISRSVWPMCALLRDTGYKTYLKLSQCIDFAVAILALYDKSVLWLYGLECLKTFTSSIQLMEFSISSYDKRSSSAVVSNSYLVARKHSSVVSRCSWLVLHSYSRFMICWSRIGQRRIQYCEHSTAKFLWRYVVKWLLDLKFISNRPFVFTTYLLHRASIELRELQPPIGEDIVSSFGKACIT